MFKYKNILLKVLSKQSNSILLDMQPVELKQRDILYDVETQIEYIYFMETGGASVITIMQDGGSIEVGMIGYEGVVGVSALLGEPESHQHVVIQLPGKAYRIKAETLKAEFDKNPEFRAVVLRFVDSFIDLSGRTAACHRLHSVARRCARWLLMASDRTGYKTLPLTHEFLSVMVGVRRSGISETVAELKRLGLIHYVKGKIDIIDRHGLENAACECYAKDSKRFKRMIK